jgi:aldoxime dehydratase
MTIMESAIPPHLRCPRSRMKRIEDDYVPPYPAWAARGRVDLQQVVMGYFGIQWRDPGLHDRAHTMLGRIASTFGLTDGPSHHDRAHFVDSAGYDTLITVAYWSDPGRYARWKNLTEVADWWDSDERLTQGLGYFREIVCPRVERFETLFSTPDRLEGVGVVMGARSDGDIQEHGYWGAMRDRFPLSQTDSMTPSGKLVPSISSGLGHRVRVSGHENVALIRSGQEWTDTKGQERTLYLEQMEPTLRAGMNFLRDSGSRIGCYVNRYMQHLDTAGRPVEKSFGLSFWRSLSDMEVWAEKHPTHLAIFGTFMRIVQQLQFQLDLRLYHEVSVLTGDEQEYEYINCHTGTGMLREAARA